MKKASIAVVAIALLAFLYYKYGRGIGGGMGYTFPNGFNDLPNWKDADDGSDTLENRKTKLMVAIASAEGFGQPNAIPTDANNPGDLTKSLGFSTTGETLGGAKIVVFSSEDDGWGALDRQLTLIQNGTSLHKLTDSILAFAQSYTATEQEAWANNVAASLGTSPDSLLSDYLT
jgi:hypothetical protein